VQRGERSAHHARRWSWCMTVVACSGALLAGCGSDGDDSDESGAAQRQVVRVAEGATGTPEKTEVTVGMLPTISHAPVVLAEREGFFKDEGITVTSKMSAGTGSGAALLGGELDLAALPWIELFVAAERGTPLQPVSEGSGGVPGLAEILVPANSDIKTVSDLVSKKVATISTPGVCDVNALDALARANTEGEPSFLPLPIPDMPGALERGDVAAVCAPEPLVSGLKASGKFRSALDVFSGPSDEQPVVGYFATSDFVEENPKTIGAFQRGLATAVRMIEEDPSVVAQIVPTYTQITPEQAKAMTVGTYPEEIDVAKLAELGALLERVGVVERAVEVTGPDAGE